MINPGDVFHYDRSQYGSVTMLLIVCVRTKYVAKYKTCTALEIHMKTGQQRIIYAAKAEFNNLCKKLNDT